MIDTTPLVALCDPRDALHERALADLDRLARRPLVLAGPVLTEACFLLPHTIQRARLSRLIAELGMRSPGVAGEALWTDVFVWLDRYEEHEPDFTDGYLVCLSDRERSARLWTYDREFVTTWRRLDGSRVNLCVKLTP